MKRQRRNYQTPPTPYDKERIASERDVVKSFGLRSKKELWKTEGMLRKYRRLARELVAHYDEIKENLIKEKLVKMGILNKESTLDSILGLSLEDFLNRRLQTVLQKKGLANTQKQARQFITHGHVLIENRKVTFPSYLVSVDDESKIVVRANPVKKMGAGETSGETATTS